MKLIDIFIGLAISTFIFAILLFCGYSFYQFALIMFHAVNNIIIPL